MDIFGAPIDNPRSNFHTVKATLNEVLKREKA